MSDTDHFPHSSAPPEGGSAQPKGLSASSVKRGSLWALAGYGGSQALRLGGNLILWRLLYPEAFGLMALVNVLIIGLAMFSDVGIGPSIIQSARGEEPTYLNTAWTIQVARGFALAITGTILAAPVAAFYGEPQLMYLIPVVSLNSIISGFNSTRLIQATRHIRLERTTILDLSSQVLGLLVMIAWGLIYRNIWALAVGGLVQASVRAVFSHTLLPGVRNRLLWDRDSAHALMSFGRWIFFSTLLTFAVSQSDRLLFGKLLPMDQLGVYSIATVWAALPITVLSSVLGTVVFSLLSRVHNEGGNVSAALLNARRPWLILCGYGIACLVAGAPGLILFLYDAKAAPAGWMTQFLAAGSWFYALESANSRALLALGKSKWIAFSSLGKLVGMVVCIPLGMHWFGFPGAVGGLAGSELLRYAVSFVGCTKMQLRTQMDDLLLTAVLVVTVLCGMLASAQVRRVVSGNWSSWDKLPYLIEICVVGLAVGVGWATLLLVKRRQTATTGG